MSQSPESLETPRARKLKKKKLFCYHNPRESLENPRVRKLKKKMFFVTIPVKFLTQVLYTLDVRFSNYDKQNDCNTFCTMYRIAQDRFCIHRKSVFRILIFTDIIISYIYLYSSHFLQHFSLNKSTVHNLRQHSKIQKCIYH